MNLPPLSTTTTGSFPRPSWLGDTAITRVTFGLSGEALLEAQRDAAALIIQEQERIGLDIITDGEMHRKSFLFHEVTTWDGINLTQLAPKTVYRNRQNERMVPRVTGPINRKGPALVAEATVGREITKRPLKIAIAGPLTIVDSTVDEHYGDEAALAMDAAIAINGELLDLQKAGVEYLQIDEPAMTRYHDKVMAFGAKALDRCLDGIRVPVFVHLCYGYPGTTKAHQHNFTYPKLLDRLMETRISGFTVEFGRSPFDPSLLYPYRDRLIMFGCVDPGDVPAPEVEDIKRLVLSALDYVGPDNLFLAPDCGLMTIPRRLAREKVQNMVEAARQLRSELS